MKTSAVGRFARGGFTYSETLLILLILATLVAILVSVVVWLRESARRTHDANNLWQIAASLIAYSQEEACAWPIGVSPSCLLPARDAHQARLVTARSMEVVAACEKLPNTLFEFTCAAIPGPTLKAHRDQTNGDAWGASQTNSVGIAFDWAAPGQDWEKPGKPTSRIILACRSPADHGDSGSLVVVGDDQVKWLKSRIGTASGLMTEDNLGKSVTTVLIDSDALGTDDNQDTIVPDNIYDDHGDAGFVDEDVRNNPLAPGMGSPRRAWVK